MDANGNETLPSARHGQNEHVTAAARNIWANIPNRSNRKQRFGFSSWLYRQRNLVERFFNRIKQFRGIATRYDKDAANYLAAIKLICARLWCNG